MPTKSCNPRTMHNALLDEPETPTETTTTTRKTGTANYYCTKCNKFHIAGKCPKKEDTG